MTDHPLHHLALSTQLCPWLRAPFERLEAARVAGRLGHAWLLAGPAGIGKINLALALAQRVLEPQRGAPAVLDASTAGAAMRHRHVPADRHPDLHWLFPEEDKRTISVDQIRAVGNELSLKSLKGAAKAVIIEPAEAMTQAAANALLKTLEEPTEDTYLWLVSHRPERLPATIRSRCQTLGVPRPHPEEALAWLEASVEDPALTRLLVLASGAPFRVLDLLKSNFHRLDEQLEDKLIAISEDRADPQVVADEWLKLDVESVLAWLLSRLQLAIRARLAPGASKSVTVKQFARLHNAWSRMTLPSLFGRLEATERLLDQLGGGINTELALRVLLLGFAPGVTVQGSRTGNHRGST